VNNARLVKGVKIGIPVIHLFGVSDSLGTSHIENIPKGSYLIEVIAGGFATKIETVYIKGDLVKNYPLELSATELKEMVITGVHPLLISKGLRTHYYGQL
jgi:iron complex outermembrane recepter protein